MKKISQLLYSEIQKIILLRKEASRSQRYTVYFYIAMCVIAALIQGMNTSLVIIGFIAAVSTMMVFLSLVNPTNYFDKEMDLLNLTAFRDVFEQNKFKNKPFRIIGLQIIGIRFLTETIGLENKQEILRQFSVKLRNACGKYQIYRISGSRIYIYIPDDDENSES